MRCVFFDRDGIVNQSPGPGYVERWEDFHLLPEFVETLRIVTRRGYQAAIVSNQRGVALGRMSAATVDDMHRRLRELLHSRHGLALLDIRYCPHERESCQCRKPKPGMLLDLAQRHGITLPDSWMVGDSPSDIEAGHAAGCHTILVGPKPPSIPPDASFASMAALAAGIDRLLSDPDRIPHA